MIKFVRFLIDHLRPPKQWRPAVIILLGVIAGFLIYIIHISKAASYLGDEPATCVNCHIMAPQYATWSHSSHREAANCNDCHVPHTSIFSKYYFKGKDGLRHSALFTLRAEPQVIFIHKAGREVVQENCLRCHEKQLTDSKLLQHTDHYQMIREERKCWDCHREVPHGRVNSLASVPFARVPLPPSPVPDWLKKSMKKSKDIQLK